MRAGVINECIRMSDIQEWYENNVDGVDQSELMHFNRKLNGVRQKWPYNVSHLVLIGMRRQSKPDKRLPEWEEIRYVIRYLKNSWRILIGK